MKKSKRLTISIARLNVASFDRLVNAFGGFVRNAFQAMQDSLSLVASPAVQCGLECEILRSQLCTELRSTPAAAARASVTEEPAKRASRAAICEVESSLAEPFVPLFAAALTRVAVLAVFSDGMLWSSFLRARAETRRPGRKPAQ